MTKNTDNFDNISFIQYLHRRVLEEAEEAITLDLPGDDKLPVTPVRTDDETAEPLPDTSQQDEINKVKKNNILKRRNRMWGHKNPLVWVFDKIADTELKIARNRPPAAPENPAALDEKDAAIVRHFVERQER